MTEQNTLMSALQVFATHIPTRMRNMPNDIRWIDFLFAEAIVLVGNLKRETEESMSD